MGSDGAHRQEEGLSRFRLDGWKGVLVGVWRAFNQDNISIIAGGVTFSILLAIFPAIAAFVAIYGLVADVSQAPRHIAALAVLLPRDVMALVGREMMRLAGARGGGLSLALAAGVAISLWSANGAMRAMIVGLNAAYAAREKRGFIKLTLVSFAFTLGLLAFLFAAVLAFGAAAVAGAFLGPDAAWFINVARWPLLLLAAAGGLSLLYRFGPCRPFARWRWITWAAWRRLWSGSRCLPRFRCISPASRIWGGPTDHWPPSSL
jgi:membrane protein